MSSSSLNESDGGRRTGDPAWFSELLGLPADADEGDLAMVAGVELIRWQAMWRASSQLGSGQRQTAEAFGYKWAKRDTFEGAEALRRVGLWLRERYGDVAAAPWWDELGPAPIVLDAGCGAGMSAIALLDSRLRNVRYIGIDVSEAVDVASVRFSEERLSAAFLQADFTELPLPDGSIDVVLAEGVLHHAPSTRDALASVVRVLRPGGRLLAYVYRKKGPVREYTDDLIRGVLADMDPSEAWQVLLPLTYLGKALGDLDVEVDVPEAIDFLGIPAGRVQVQRLFYWYFCKAFYGQALTIEEMNHINFDWYAPTYAHRQTPEEFRSWCDDLSLVVEREIVEEAGISVVCRKAG